MTFNPAKAVPDKISVKNYMACEIAQRRKMSFDDQRNAGGVMSS
jgi:hypothetical protein